ncbi:MAG: OmpA family protein [candidate division KSB1 bacterium]|nr:OmpA family protein [candidate division KSB1 bacterium]
MFKNLILILMIMIFIFTGIRTGYSQEDAQNSKDHPMISRYEGSYIIGYETIDYDRLVFPAGLDGEEMSERVEAEGQVTRILYVAPQGLSSLQVHRNYQMALKDAGFAMVFECMEECDPIENMVYGDDQRLKNYDPSWLPDEALLPWNTKDERYVLARLPDADATVYVSVYTALHHSEGKEQLVGHPVTLIQVLEEKPMSTGKVEVDIDAEAMAKDLDKKGSVRIYGIHFDTDKAIVKETSESVLAEIAKLLEQNPDLDLRVVGHTDAAGSLQHNMDLSKQRAEAVVEFLSSEHGISTNRLKPYGVGPLAPVAGNQDEDSRARNRRVELVKIVEQ